MAFSAQPHAAPIKLEGFDIPGTSTGPNSNGFSVDPTHLYGAVGGFGSQQGRAGYYGGSGAGFSELDLDFETTLASLAQHGQHGANPYNPSSSHQHSHSFGGGGGGGGSLGLGGQGAGANGYLGTSNANFEQFGYHRIDKQQPQQQPPPPPLAPTSTTANNYPGLPPFLTSSAPRQSPSIPAFTAAPSPHHHDSRSPTAILSPQAMDMFGNVCSPAPAPMADSPANEFGSYSSVGDAFSQPQLSTSSSTSNSATKKGSAARGRSPPDHSQPPTERGRAAGRSTSKSSQAGKAPTSRVRSRSARRNATGVAYQAMGTGGAAQQATAAASSSTAAIVIPGASGSAAAVNHHHPLAMSMPAYGTNGATGTGGLPSASWFASGQALGLGGAGVGEGQHATDETDLTGWRPSAEQKGPGLVPASAPTLGAAKKGKAALDDVPEDATSKQAALLTEKRRKRRESHNAVERRRRDNINDRITDLASLLPEVLLEQANNGKEDDFGNGVPDSPLTAMLSPAPGTIGLPPLLGTSPATPTLLAGAHMTQGAGAAAAAAGKPNKGIILAKSVEYIRYLQQLVELHAQRNSELERLVQQLRLDPSSGGGGQQQQQHHHQHTSSSTSFETSSGGNTSEARSPASAGAGLTASMASSHFGDPNFNENFMNATNGAFGGAEGGNTGSGQWSMLTTPKEEDMDES